MTGGLNLFFHSKVDEKKQMTFFMSTTGFIDLKLIFKLFINYEKKYSETSIV